MTIKLYGHPGAICTKRVIVTLQELNVPYELVLVNILKGEQKKPEYLAKHPFGKIPYLEDDNDGEVVGLSESRAICRYLARRYAGKGVKLIPDEGDWKAFALFEEAGSWEQNNFNPPADGASLEYHFAGLRGRSPDMDLVKKHIETLDEVLKTYDQILSKRAYMAGDKFTLVDIFHGPLGVLVQQAGAKENFEKYANVKKWWADISGRESFKALDVPFE